jgi:hypothetical protein
MQAPRPVPSSKLEKPPEARQAVRLSNLDRRSQARVVAAYAKLPLSFEANQGQTNSAVKFMSRGSGYTLFLTGDEAVLGLRRCDPKLEIRNWKLETGNSELEGRVPGSLVASLEVPMSNLANRESQILNPRFPISNAAPPVPSPQPLAPSQPQALTALRMKLVGANANAAATGAEELPGKVNYFIGNDPKKWRTSVPTYAKVRFKDVYPGIDLVYYGNHGGQLEYDFVVAPGADPRAIALDVGAGLPRHALADIGGVKPPLQIAADGDLVIPTDDGGVRFHKPIVYQPKVTNGQRTAVDAHFTPDAENRVHIALGPYDHSKPLVIDPALVYSTYLGGSNSDFANGIAADSSGNVYVTGETNSPDFPTANPLQASLAGLLDAFVTKLSWNGTSLSMVYSTYLGGGYTGSGANTSISTGIAVDSSGNAYITGFTTSPNFPTANAIQDGLAGLENGFVAELNAEGSALVYCTYLGGSLFDYGQGIAVDHAGNAYVTGMTGSADFPTANAYQSANGSATSPHANAFVAKLNWSGSALSLVYSTYLGGSTSDSGQGIAVDSAGNAYITGSTLSKDFPTTPGAFQTSLAGAQNAFVSKLSWNGNVLALAYSTFLGGSFVDTSNSIAVDSSANAYVTGYTLSSDFPTVAPLPSSSPSSFVGGAFVSKLNPTGSSLVYSTFLGATYIEPISSTVWTNVGATPSGSGIAVDSSGNAYIAGIAGPGSFPVENPLQASSGGFGNAFVAELSWNGSALGLVYCTYLGGSGADGAGAIALDSSGNAYVAGETDSADFPTVNPLQESLAGVRNAFVAKISAASGTGITLSSNTVIFSNEPVNSTSSVQSVTLTNSGTGPATITAINVTGHYALTTTSTSCAYNGGSVPAGNSCTIDITFTPTATGRRNGSVTVNDNSGGGPQSITLVGVGISGYPMAQVAPSTLTFGSQNLGTTSAPQPVTLTNTGGSVLILSGMVGGGSVGGGFPFINSDVSLKCASNIAAGGSCTFNVTFSPMVDGPVTETLTFVDNSGGVLGSTQSVSLTGTGTGTAPPPPSPSPLAELLLGAPLQFPSVLVKSTGNPQAVTLHNVGNAALAVSSITASSNFAETNNCGSSVPAGGSCTIYVALAPLVGGLLSGNLTVVDNSNNQAGSAQSVSMTGWGEDFTLATASGSSSSATAAPGQTATYALTLGDTGVFNSSVALTCTGAPAESACTVSPNPAARRSNITVGVATTAPSAVAPWAIPPVWPRLPLSRTPLMLAVLLAGAAWAVWGWKESGARRRRTLLLPLAAGLLLILVMAACGGGGNRTSNPGTLAGTYVLTVTGTAGSGSTALSHNVTLTLTVR